MILHHRTIGSLRRKAPKRLPGYLEECLKRGQIPEGVNIITDETPITFTDADFQDIRRQFNPKHGGTRILRAGCC